MPYKNIDKQRKVQSDSAYNRHKKYRFIIMQFLGGKCVRCGFDDIRCLNLDHIKPILRTRNNLKHKSSTKLQEDIIHDREDLDNIQILCANCHSIKSYHEDIVSY